MDRWIMSRLSLAISDANRGFDNYDFSSVTKALYNFWLYDLCDVYFEALKPVIYGEDGDAKLVSRNVLYPHVARDVGVLCGREGESLRSGFWVSYRNFRLGGKYLC